MHQTALNRSEELGLASVRQHPTAPRGASLGPLAAQGAVAGASWEPLRSSAPSCALRTRLHADSSALCASVPPPPGTCDTWVNRRLETAGSTASTGSGGEDCSQIAWLRWTGGTTGARGGAGGSPIVNIWTFIGNVGVTLMIFQSGMHIHFDKVAQVGRKAFVVAVFGTALPLLTGMAVVGGLTGEYYPLSLIHI